MVAIYSLSDPRTGCIRYVGQTTAPESRRRFHNNDRFSKTRRASWIKSLRRRGLRPLFEIIEWVGDEIWEEAERFWIAYLRFLGCVLTNHALGGNGKGKHSAETRARQSAIKIGRKLSPEHRKAIGDSLRGRRLSAEQCALLSKLKTGRRLSESTKDKLRAINLGKIHPPRSPEYRRKLSLALTGRKMSTEARRAMSIAATGRRHTPETALKISIGLRGKPKTKEHAAAAGRALRGRTLSALSIAKRTATRYGRPLVLPL